MERAAPHFRATIAILTYDGIEWINQLLDSCSRQVTDFDFEILVIDSGSTDGTLDAVRRRNAVRLHEIPNSGFGHGRTRNLAVEMALGDFVVFVTQDAMPATSQWLSELLAPFEVSDRVACVYGKQVPRSDCCPTVKRDVINHFRSFGPDPFVMLQQANPNLTGEAERDALSFFSDVNSAVRRSTMQTIRFRDVAYAEDQALGRDVIEAGLIKAYAPLAAVVHSHSYPPRRYFARMYDEMAGLRMTTGRSIDTSLPRHIAIVLRNTVKDWAFILRDRDYGPWTKAKWFAQAPIYNAARRTAVRLALRSSLPGWAAWMMRPARGARVVGDAPSSDPTWSCWT